MVDETGSRGKDAAYFKEGDEDMIYESAQDRYQDYEDNKKAVSPFRIGEIAPFVDENLNKLVMFSGRIGRVINGTNVCQHINQIMGIRSF